MRRKELTCILLMESLLFVLLCGNKYFSREICEILYVFLYYFSLYNRFIFKLLDYDYTVEIKLGIFVIYCILG